MAPALADTIMSTDVNEDEEFDDFVEGTTTLTLNNEKFEQEKQYCFKKFDSWQPEDQIDFIEDLLLRMTHYQHGHINAFLKPMLQRDFISALPGRICIW